MPPLSEFETPSFFNLRNIQWIPIKLQYEGRTVDVVQGISSSSIWVPFLFPVLSLFHSIYSLHWSYNIANGSWAMTTQKGLSGFLYQRKVSTAEDNAVKLFSATLSPLKDKFGTGSLEQVLSNLSHQVHHVHRALCQRFSCNAEKMFRITALSVLGNALPNFKTGFMAWGVSLCSKCAWSLKWVHIKLER